ncbi:MAG: recombinase family protein [Actinobacteria bacterium]|nr:recombinase family protein [Actinomycetota bacterium]
MKPLMYGYVRVADEAQDDEINQTEGALRSFADTEGYCYATTFYEHQSGSHAAFEELTEELQRADAHYVVVLSLDHVSRHPLLRSHMLRRLEAHANALVLTVEP